MNNRELEAAWNYHNRTKHSYHSVRNSSHFLDWENQPLPFKIYSNLDPISLPHDLNSSGVSALKAIADPGPRKETKTKIDKQLLAEILHFAAGITKRRTYPGGEILFRAAACTGALYHIDLYAVCGELEDLAAGIYQFSPQDFSLRRLREGDYRPNLVAASGDDPNVVGAPVTLVCASTYWRNSWKYQARAYRHCYWDNGTILGNLLAVAAARQVRSSVILGFVDSEVGDLLSLDPQREAPLSLVPLGSGSSDLPPPSLAVKPLHQETSPLSKKEIDYPAIREMHLASSLERGEEVTLWRQHAKAASKAKTGATPGGTVL
ncbi:MAG: SagB/ThcOx family dehydrogenase, partial [Deltaproteobacteria bacterium]|nr:SagB/ThcOx family dehydrogenase [Deltaproteobacteria bacterium]